MASWDGSELDIGSKLELLYLLFLISKSRYYLLLVKSVSVCSRNTGAFKVQVGE